MMFDDGVAGVTAAGVRARLAGEVPAATGENGAGGAGLANGGAGEAEKTNGNGAGGR